MPKAAQTAADLPLHCMYIHRGFRIPVRRPSLAVETGRSACELSEAFPAHVQPATVLSASGGRGGLQVPRNRLHRLPVSAVAVAVTLLYHSA